MDATIELTRLAAPEGVLPAGQRHAWPLTIVARGIGMPSEVFVYQIGNSIDSDNGDLFSCVASVNQMEELPRYEGATVTRSEQIPYYRRSVLEFVCRSAFEANRIWNVVQEDIYDLVANYNLTPTLQGVERVMVGSEDLVNYPIEMSPPIMKPLFYQPAGQPTFTSGVQGIINPDPTLTGWLPVSSANPAWIKPAGAFLFYNIELDLALATIWPPAQPYSGTQLFRNGLLLPYSITHVFTRDTIWWLAFNPSSLPGYVNRSPEAADGNCPWPTDYVSRMNPGAVTPMFTLTVFK